MGEPDATQHARPLGSPEHLAVLRQADANAGRVIEAVDRLRDKGDDVLLIACSDHGHQTVSRIIDVEAELVAAGLKASRESGDVVTPTSGTSTLVYVHPEHAGKIDAIGAFLAGRDWVDRVVPAAELASVGQAPRHGLAFAISLKSDDEPNAFGVRGHSYESKPVAGKGTHLHCGQHGGLARYEQMPFLMIDGAGFTGGAMSTTPTSPIDLAPTILAHLRLPAEGMDGRGLQEPLNSSPLDVSRRTYMIVSGKKDDDEHAFVLGFAEAQTTYQSASQSARVLTEGWVEQQAFCTNCGNDKLTRFANNRPLADFFCSSCNEEFELKSKKGAFGARVANGAYARKIERLNSSTNPNLLLLNYNLKELSVTDLMVIPKHFFVPSVIEKRKPLRDTAQRAGWVGSNIILRDIPDSGKSSS